MVAYLLFLKMLPNLGLCFFVAPGFLPTSQPASSISLLYPLPFQLPHVWGPQSLLHSPLQDLKDIFDLTSLTQVQIRIVDKPPTTQPPKECSSPTNHHPRWCSNPRGPKSYQVAGTIISNFQTDLDGCLSNVTTWTHASEAFPLDQASVSVFCKGPHSKHS